MDELIGPLTAQEWCAFRQQPGDDDLLTCCAVTSDFRDALFRVLRMGGGRDFAFLLREEWDAMNTHGWPEDVPQLDKLRAYYFPECEGHHVL